MNNEEEIKIMLENGIEANDVAKELGVHLTTVYRIAEQILSERREGRNQLIVAAYAERWPIKAIRDTFGISTATVYNVLDKYNISRHNAQVRHSAETDQAIVALYKRGASLKTIREWSGATVTYIYKVLDTAKVPRRRPQGPETSTIESINVKTIKQHQATTPSTISTTPNTSSTNNHSSSTSTKHHPLPSAEQPAPR